MDTMIDDHMIGQLLHQCSCNVTFRFVIYRFDR